MWILFQMDFLLVRAYFSAVRLLKSRDGSFVSIVTGMLKIYFQRNNTVHWKSFLLKLEHMSLKKWWFLWNVLLMRSKAVMPELGSFYLADKTFVVKRHAVTIQKNKIMAGKQDCRIAVQKWSLNNFLCYESLDYTLIAFLDYFLS